MCYYKLSCLIVLIGMSALFVGCQNEATQATEHILTPKVVLDSVNIDLNQYAAAEHLINPKKLTAWEQTDSISLVLIDIRPQQDYALGHLNNAHQVWRPEIRNASYPYSGMMASKEALAAFLGRIGATSKSHIVLYDASGNADAARLWWMLAVYGHSNAFILNGGLVNVDSTKLTTIVPEKETTVFEFSQAVRPELLATKEDILKALEDEDYFILDCRTTDEYTGKTMKKGAFRAGHIPKALHIDYSEAIAYERTCTFRDYKDLMARFSAIPKDKKVLVYCQSGVRSAHMTFVLRELLGYPDVANYDGSWIEWSYDKNLPIESEVLTESKG